MSLTTPDSPESLEQALYRVCAKTGIKLDATRLQPTLLRAAFDTASPAAVIFHLLIDSTSRETMKASAAHVREIADLIEAAADKPS